MADRVETENSQEPADRLAAIHSDAGHTPMTKHSAFWSQYFYFFMSLLVAAVLLYGFSHTIDQNLIHPKIPRPRLLYLHAALFTGWPVFHLAELTGTDAQRPDSPDDRMVWRGNGSADSAGGNGNCRNDGQIRHDAIENEQRRRRHDHSHVGHGGLHSGVWTSDLLEEEAGVSSAAAFDCDLCPDGGWLGTFSGVAAATGDFLCRRGFTDSAWCFSRLDGESESSPGILIRTSSVACRADRGDVRECS